MLRGFAVDFTATPFVDVALCGATAPWRSARRSRSAKRQPNATWSVDIGDRTQRHYQYAITYNLADGTRVPGPQGETDDPVRVGYALSTLRSSLHRSGVAAMMKLPAFMHKQFDTGETVTVFQDDAQFWTVLSDSGVSRRCGTDPNNNPVFQLIKYNFSDEAREEDPDTADAAAATWCSTPS